MKYSDITRGGYDAPRVRAAVCVKDLNTGGVVGLAEAEVTNHNGSNAMWITDDLLAFQSRFLNSFDVYNVPARKRICRRRGELGHSSVNGLIPFTVCNFPSELFGFDADPVPPDEEGVYVFNPDSGESRQVISLPAILGAVKENHSGLSLKNARLMHLDLSPSGDRFLFDYRCDEDSDKQGGFFQGYVNSDGTDCRIIPIRCAHTLWFDNDSFFGPRNGVTGRYDLRGNRIEVLGGITCHAAATADGSWIAGDIKPGDDGTTRLALYRRGGAEPAVLAGEWGFPHVTWEWVAHANPVFSQDGGRLYFVRPSGDDRFEGCCFDMAFIEQDS